MQGEEKKSIGMGRYDKKISRVASTGSGSSAGEDVRKEEKYV